MNILKQELLFTTGGLLILSSCVSDSNEKENNTRNENALPNIVLIVADDHGRGDLGCYGNTAIQTPNLDALAAEGIRMTNAYCTSASCSASRSVILSGLYNHANGHYGHQHDFHHFSAYSTVRSLPVLLSENNYNTMRIGKYHVAPESVFKFDKHIEHNNRNVVQMADKCEEYIKSVQDPFFIYFCTFDPHRSGEYATEIEGQPNRFGNKPEGFPGVETRVFSPDSVIVPDYLPDTPECRAEIAQYYQSVYRMDQGIGRLFKYLKENGKWENTVIIYISDNGIAFPGAKTTQYDPGIHLPCIIKYPGLKNPGSENNAMFTWADLTPTILDFAGILPEDNSIPDAIETDRESDYSQEPWSGYFNGRSIIPVLKAKNYENFNEVFTSHTFHEITMYYPMRTFQNRKYKLIWNIAYQLPYPHATDLWASPTWQSALNSGTGLYAGKSIEAFTNRTEFELFDMENDPGELKNLAYEPAYTDVLETMKEKLKEYQEKTADPWFAKWYHE